MPTTLYNALGEYIDLLLDAVCVVDREGRFQFLSSGAERIFGYPAAEMLGRSMLEFIHPDDIEKTLAVASAINTGQVKVDFENRYRRKDGQIVYLLWSARWSADKQQRVAVARDITGLKQAEKRQQLLYAISEAAFAAEDLPALYRQLLQIAQQMIPIRACVIARTEAGGIMNIAYQYLPAVEQRHATEAAELCQLLLQQSQSLVVPLVQRRTDGCLWLGVRLTSHQTVLGAMVLLVPPQTIQQQSADAGLLDFVAQHMAVAIERKELLARLQQHALYDELTALPRRELFYDRCRQALVNARRHGSKLAVCYLDLDNFKPVNDQYGHAIGDVLLQQVAQRLQQAVRQVDTVARFGGDEFVLLLTELQSEVQAQAIADKVLKSLQQPFLFGSVSLQITLSIGMVFDDGAAQNLDKWLLGADQAMYQAKQSGGNRCVLAGSKLAPQ